MDKQKLKEQQEIAAELQMALLKDLKTVFETPGKATAADRMVLYRILRDNGWNLDPSKLPKELQDLVKNLGDPKNIEEEDEAVVGRIAM